MLQRNIGKQIPFGRDGTDDGLFARPLQNRFAYALVHLCEGNGHGHLGRQQMLFFFYFTAMRVKHFWFRIPDTNTVITASRSSIFSWRNITRSCAHRNADMRVHCTSTTIFFYFFFSMNMRVSVEYVYECRRFLSYYMSIITIVSGFIRIAYRYRGASKKLVHRLLFVDVFSRNTGKKNRCVCSLHKKFTHPAH